MFLRSQVLRKSMSTEDQKTSCVLDLTRTYEDNTELANRWEGYATKATLAMDLHKAIAASFGERAVSAQHELRKLQDGG
jgi:hypothetical protein